MKGRLFLSLDSLVLGTDGSSPLERQRSPQLGGIGFPLNLNDRQPVMNQVIMKFSLGSLFKHLPCVPSGFRSLTSPNVGSKRSWQSVLRIPGLDVIDVDTTLAEG